YLAAANGTVFFSADDGVNGREPWKSDGTPEGTVMLADLAPGSVGSDAVNFTNVNGTVFFTASGPTTTGLWKTDGTEAGTVQVRSGFLGSVASLPNVNGTLFFVANDGVNGVEPWKSDGTTAGTVLVKNIRSFSS